MGVQYHWRNMQYESFAHYLSFFNAKHRKNVRRERRKISEQDISVVLKTGHEMTEHDWNQYYHFYHKTFDEKWGTATLTQDFFTSLGAAMPDNIIVLFAVHDNRYVASAFLIKSASTLYGRYWGCTQNFDSLHFELCYYQGLEYCIRHGLSRFEPGAQGEHKISRGFLPTATWSAHWIANPSFHDILEKYLLREIRDMQSYKHELMRLSPFKCANTPMVSERS